MNALRRISDFFSKLSKRLLLLLVRMYQLMISPLMTNHCRFEPTCSRYALIAIDRFGVFKGTYLAARRILRCRPGVPGGWDPVPEKKSMDDDVAGGTDNLSSHHHSNGRCHHGHHGHHG